MTTANGRPKPAPVPDDLDALYRETVRDAYATFRAAEIEDRGWRQVGSNRLADRTLRDLECARADVRRLLEGSEYDDGNEFAIGAAVNRRNYACGQDGLKYEAVSTEGVVAPPALLDVLNQFIKLFAEVNNLPELEAESVWRWDRDGESFLRLFDTGDVPEVEFIEPERVRPPSAADLAARCPEGIETEPGNRRRRVRYWFEPEIGREPEPVPEAEIVHTRANVTRTCLRGWPTFEPIVKALRRAEKLVIAGTVTGTNQAKLSLIWQRDNFTKDKADALVNRLTGKYRLSPDGRELMPVSVDQLPDGAVLNASKSDQITVPNTGNVAPLVEALIQINLRAAAVATRMPEWMFSGVASDKYANAFVAEGPALREFRAIQKRLAASFGEGRLGQQASLVWRAVRMAVRNRVLPPDVLRLCRIKVTPPSLETRDKNAEASMHSTYLDKKVYTADYVRQQIGVPDSEGEKVKAEGQAAAGAQPGAAPGVPADPLAGMGGMAGGPAAPVMDSFAAGVAFGEWVRDSGFTGKITDRIGRDRYYQDGKQVPGPAAAPSDPGGHPPPKADAGAAKASPRAAEDAPLHGEVVARKKKGGGVNVSEAVTLAGGTMGLWKPAAGERAGLRKGIPDGTGYKRETASSHAAAVLGMADAVPPTVAREIDGQVGSVQKWVGGAKEADRVTNPFDGEDGHARAAAFDFVTGQSDRHPGNWMLTDAPVSGFGDRVKAWAGARRPGEHLRLIDNGLSFPTEESTTHFMNSDLLRGAVGKKIPDLSAWEGKRAEFERAAAAAGVEPAAVKAAGDRLDAAVAASKAGKTFGDLTYAGKSVADGMREQPVGFRVMR